MQQANSSQPESETLVFDVESGDGEHVSRPNDSNSVESASRSICRYRIPIILIAAVLIALLVGFCIGFSLGQSKTSDHPNGQKQKSVANEPNSPDLLVNPQQPCDDSTYCEKCTAPAISPMRPEIEGMGSCQKSAHINEGGFECNGSYISSGNLTELLNRRIKCNDTLIEVICCHLVCMQSDKYCGENGEYICINDAEPPFCKCKANWTGLVCEHMDIQEVQCNCFTLGKAVAYADNTSSCNDAGRPANWTECSLTGFRGPTPMNCICAPSNTTDTRFFPDDESNMKNCDILPS